MGIPFFITRNLNQALKHRMVILYPEVGPTTFSEADAQQLLAFVKQGETSLRRTCIGVGSSRSSASATLPLRASAIA